MKKYLGLVLFSMLFGTISVFAAPSLSPDGSSSAQGLFATYFENMANNPCTGNDILVGFSNTADANFLKTSCLSIGSRLASFLGGYGVAPTGQAVIGFDTTTGAPKYGIGGWGLTGNTGTTAGTNFVGTTDAIDLVFKTNNSELMRLASAGYNVKLGGSSSGSSLNGIQNVAIGGYNPGNSANGFQNVYIGGQSAGVSSSGTLNVIIGGQSGGNFMSGTNNTTVGGIQAGIYMAGSRNTVLGGEWPGYQSSAYAGTMIGGRQAGYLMGGQWNTAIGGYNAGFQMVGTRNTAIGPYTTVTNGSVNDSVVIGSGAYSNQTAAIVIGGSGSNVGIGVPDPGAKLDVNGDIQSRGTMRSMNGLQYSNNQKMYSNAGWTYFTNTAGGYSNGIAAKYFYADTNISSPTICIGTSCINSWSDISGLWDDMPSGPVYYTGSVGIGTFSPSARLHVIGNSTSALIVSPSDGRVANTWPTGWGGGIQTWDILAQSVQLRGGLYSDGVVRGGSMYFDGGSSIRSDGRMHIQSAENLFLNPWGGTTYVGYGGGPGNLSAAGYLQGTRYYDDDTTYYVDSNSWSNMNYINAQDIYIRSAGKYVSQMGGWICVGWVQHVYEDGRGEGYQIYKSSYNESGNYPAGYRGIGPPEWYKTQVSCTEL